MYDGGSVLTDGFCPLLLSLTCKRARFDLQTLQGSVEIRLAARILATKRPPFRPNLMPLALLLQKKYCWAVIRLFKRYSISRRQSLGDHRGAGVSNAESSMAQHRAAAHKLVSGFTFDALAPACMQLYHERLSVCRTDIIKLMASAAKILSRIRWMCDYWINTDRRSEVVVVRTQRRRYCA